MISCKNKFENVIKISDLNIMVFIEGLPMRMSSLAQPTTLANN